MNRIFFISILFYLSISSLQAQSDTLHLETPGSDSIEYELYVQDPGFETFLLSQPPMEFHSQSYYESWNLRYVQEWNYRHSQPFEFGDNYETYIDYQQDIDYGLELNYKLYYYFKFFEKENRVKLLPGKNI